MEPKPSNAFITARKGFYDLTINPSDAIMR
jgi:hypothetical protein